MIDGGNIVYAPVVEFADSRTRNRWSAEAVKAIEARSQRAQRPRLRRAS